MIRSSEELRAFATRRLDALIDRLPSGVREEALKIGYRLLDRHRHDEKAGKTTFGTYLSYNEEITLYVQTIHTHSAAEGLDFGRELDVTYLHELGHHLGLSEDDLDERGLGEALPVTEPGVSADPFGVAEATATADEETSLDGEFRKRKRQATGVPWALWIGLVAIALLCFAAFRLFPGDFECSAPTVSFEDRTYVDFMVMNHTREPVTKTLRVEIGRWKATKYASGRSYYPDSETVTVSLGPLERKNIRCAFPLTNRVVTCANVAVIK